MPSTQHNVAIVQTERGFLVRPASVLAADMDGIRFVNLTHLKCQVLVPRYSFLGEAGLIEVLEPGIDFGPVSIHTSGIRGSCPYQVYLFSPPETPALLAQRVFARGDSAPHVIIE